MHRPIRQSLVFLVLVAGVLPARAANPPQVQGSASVVVGYPTGASTKLNPYSITIYYLDPTGVQKSAIITVPNVVATAGLPAPTAAQVSAASAAKAALIIAAINAAQIPCKPVTINGTTYNTVTAIPNINTTPGMYATGKFMLQNVNGVPTQVPVMAPGANFSGYTVNGVTQKLIDGNTAAARLENSVYRSAGNTVTGEIGNGKSPFTPGGVPSNGGAQQMTFGGLGSDTGSALGLDASGDLSIVGFGFVDETGTTPTDFIAAFNPSPGMTDGTVLTDLASLFTEDFGSDGYTATYDPTTDLLSINQPLPAVDLTWSADSDPGLFLDDTSSPIPEPSSWLLLATGLLGTMALRRWGMRARA